MAAPLAPTRQELLDALRFPVLMAPFLALFVRYRVVWQFAEFGRKDKADAGQAWKLSGYVAILFMFVAYPITLSKYDGWLWSAHARLVVGSVSVWVSLGSWILVRYFQLHALADEKLQKDLQAMWHGSPLPPPVASPVWLKRWGTANAVALLFVLLAIALLVKSL